MEELRHEISQNLYCSSVFKDNRSFWLSHKHHDNHQKMMLKNQDFIFESGETSVLHGANSNVQLNPDIGNSTMDLSKSPETGRANQDGVKDTMKTSAKVFSQNISNKNMLENSFVNKVDKQDRKRKTSVTVNGKLLNFESNNELGANVHLKCVHIDIGENKKFSDSANKNKEKPRDIFAAKVSLENKQIIQDGVIVDDERVIGKCFTNKKEVAEAKRTLQDKEELDHFKNRHSGDKQIVVTENKCSSLSTPITKFSERSDEVYFENSFNYTSPQYVNLDTLENQDWIVQQEKVNLNQSNSDSLVVLTHKRQNFSNTSRRRSLSAGHLDFPKVTSFTNINQFSKSVNNIAEKRFCTTHIISSGSDFTSSDDEIEVNKRVNLKSKKSFIAKSISVDIVSSDSGFEKRKNRRPGVFFDSQSVDSNSGEDDFLTDLLQFKKNYKLQKREKSTGLRIARSVENLLKIDRPRTRNRQRSNTETEEPTKIVKKRPKFLTKKARNKKSNMEYIRETSLLDDDVNAETEKSMSKPRISLVGNSVQKVAGIIEMYMDKKGDVIRKIEIHKVQDQSLGFFIRFGNGIEREMGIFISRVTLGSFMDVNNLLHAGDEILSINKVDVTDHSLEEVALMMQRSETLIIKTRSALPLPMYARPLLKSYDTTYDREEIKSTLAEHEEGNKYLRNHHRASSDPLLLNESSEEDDTWCRRSRTDTNPNIFENYTPTMKTKSLHQRKLNDDNKTERHQLKDDLEFNRTLPPTPDDISANRKNRHDNSKSFSRAQRYLTKSPTLEIDNIEYPKSSKTSFIKSPKFLRKSDGKKSPLLNGASHFLLPRSNSMQSYSSSCEDDLPSQPRQRAQVYASDGDIIDYKSTENYNGHLVVHVQQLLGRLSSLDGDCFCSIEVDDEYKAATQPKLVKDVVHFDDYFEIELRHAFVLKFLIFFKQGKRQPKLLSQYSIHLHRLLGKQNKAQLLLATTHNVQLRIGLEFTEVVNYLQRSQSTRQRGVFGFNLSQTLVEEENTVPILVRKCVEEIEKRGLDLVGIYRISGNARKKKLLRMQFDEDSINADVSDSDIDCHVIAGILKDYLRELPNPLISQETYLNIYNKSLEKNQASTTKLLGELMRQLPCTNRATLIYIMEHLQRVAERSSENKMDYKNLAVCFGPVMMCPPITKCSNVADMFDFKKQIQALEFLLTVWPSKSQQNSV